MFLIDEGMRLHLADEPTSCSEQSKDDIAGWTPQLGRGKTDQLASVIAATNTGQGPDLLHIGHSRISMSSWHLAASIPLPGHIHERT
jgi:hypothetical protein